MRCLWRHLWVACACVALWLTVPSMELKSMTYEEFAEMSENHTYPPTDKTYPRKLIVTTLLELPYVTFKQHGVFLTGKDRFEGFLLDVLEHLATSVGFDYELRLARDGQRGGRGENGSWTGMIGELARGEADLAAAPLTINQDHVEAVDFTEPFMTLRSAALLQKPRRRNNNKDDKNENKNDNPQPQPQQQKRSRRSRIRTITDLLQSDFHYGVIARSHTEELIRLSFDPAHQALWSRMNTFWPTVFVQNVQEGVQRVRHENFAFILDLPMAEYLAGRKPCDLYVTEPFLYTREYALAMRKGDPLKAQIDKEIVRMRISGEMEAISMKWWTEECNKKRDANGGGEKVVGADTTPMTPWRFGTAEGYNEKGSGVVNRSTSGGHKTTTGSKACVALSVIIMAIVQFLACHGHMSCGVHNINTAATSVASDNDTH